MYTFRGVPCRVPVILFLQIYPYISVGLARFFFIFLKNVNIYRIKVPKCYPKTIAIVLKTKWLPPSHLVPAMPVDNYGSMVLWFTQPVFLFTKLNEILFRTLWWYKVLFLETKINKVQGDPTDISAWTITLYPMYPFPSHVMRFMMWTWFNICAWIFWAPLVRCIEFSNRMFD